MSLENELKITVLHIQTLEQALAGFNEPKVKAELYTELAKSNSKRALLELRIAQASGDEDPDLPSEAVVETSINNPLRHQVGKPIFGESESKFEPATEALDLPGDDFDLPAEV